MLLFYDELCMNLRMGNYVYSKCELSFTKSAKNRTVIQNANPAEIHRRVMTKTRKSTFCQLGHSVGAMCAELKSWGCANSSLGAIRTCFPTGLESFFQEMPRNESRFPVEGMPFTGSALVAPPSMATFCGTIVPSSRGNRRPWRRRYPKELRVV
jgi:hypothetical protein